MHPTSYVCCLFHPQSARDRSKSDQAWHVMIDNWGIYLQLCIRYVIDFLFVHILNQLVSSLVNVIWIGLPSDSDWTSDSLILLILNTQLGQSWGWFSLHVCTQWRGGDWRISGNFVKCFGSPNKDCKIVPIYQYTHYTLNVTEVTWPRYRQETFYPTFACRKITPLSL
jgi:hypothetical protein